MRHSRLIKAAMLATILTGCSATYTQAPTLVATTKLSTAEPVVIATPAPGSYGDENYPESGQDTASAINAAFSRHATSVKTAKDCQDLDCLTEKYPRFTYYVVPEILHWEERATEWSGKPDRIEVKISVIDKRTSKPAAVTIITGKSQWATFGGDHPQDLLPEPINRFVDSLY